MFHRDVHAKGLAVSYDEDASFLALMRGAAAASPAPRRRKRPPRKRRSRDRRRLVDPNLDAVLRETAASPKKPPRGSFDSNDWLASFVSTTRRRGGGGRRGCGLFQDVTRFGRGGAGVRSRSPAAAGCRRPRG